MYVGFASWWVADRADVDPPDYRPAPSTPSGADRPPLRRLPRRSSSSATTRATAVVGDSAGASLTVSTVRSLREMGMPSPAALVLISPWLDLSLSGASVGLVGRRDPMLRRDGLAAAARDHAAGLHLDDPRISPLFAELRTLPPTLVQVGTDEILLDDSTRFADRAYAAGVEVELQRFDGLFHDFQLFAKAAAVVARSDR